MTARDTIKVFITGDASGFKKATQDVERSASGLSGKMKGALAGLSVVAVGTGVLKVAGDFEKTALAARDFAVASGLSGVQAAKWQEAASSIGVDTGSLSTAIGKLTRNLGTSEEKFKKLGVTVARTKDGQVDANATFLNAIDVVSKIEDPLQRSKVASQLFGKSWQELAPLIEIGAGGVKDQLNQVSDAQANVGSKENIDKAKKYQGAMDNLGDSVKQVEFKMAGALIPVLTTVGTILSGMPPQLLVVGGALVVAAVGVDKLSGAFTLLAANPALIGLGAVAVTVERLVAGLDKLHSAGGMTQGQVTQFGPALTAKVATGKVKVPAGYSFNGTSLQPVKPPDTSIWSAIGLGVKGFLGMKASGGPVLGGGTYLVGEKGPELVTFPRNGYVTPNSTRMTSGGVVVNLTVQGRDYDERQLALMLRRELDRSRRAGGAAA